MTYFGSFTDQFAVNLAALRPLVVAKRFDAVATVNATRQVSAVLTAYDGLEQRLGSCEATSELIDGVKSIRKSARALLERVQAPGISDAGVRKAAVSLVGLLPKALALSKAGVGVANGLGIAMQVAEVPKGSTKVIGALPALTTPKPNASPIPTPPARATPRPASSSIQTTTTREFAGYGVRASDAITRVSATIPATESHWCGAGMEWHDIEDAFTVDLTTSTGQVIYIGNWSGCSGENWYGGSSIQIDGGDPLSFPASGKIVITISGSTLKATANGVTTAVHIKGHVTTVFVGFATSALDAGPIDTQRFSAISITAGGHRSGLQAAWLATVKYVYRGVGTKVSTSAPSHGNDTFTIRRELL